MEDEENDMAPWLEKSRFGHWEVNTGSQNLLWVNCGANQTIRIDKLYGSLCSTDVRIKLELSDRGGEWVVERQKLMEDSDGNSIEDEWIEMARWNCQMDWPKEK